MDNGVSMVLANGIVKANTELASLLRERLIETLPPLADATRPHAKKFVRPPHFLTFLTRTQVLREGYFTRSRVSTMMPISFHPPPLQ